MIKGLASAISIVDEKPDMASGSAAPVNHDEVRVPDISEYKGLALSLAHSFAVDEVAMYFIDTPDRQHWTEEQKWELHLATMEYIVYAHFLDGLVATIGENYGAVALW
jgi:hypothetical protein